ncbi:MAG: asparaginase domain-containing protein, partial [Capnocytophaga gingivalis]
MAARQAGIGGVFVSFGGRVLRADAVYKQHANRTDAFAAGAVMTSGAAPS